MNLCGPILVRSLRGSSYIFVIVDDYLRLTWVSFLKEKMKHFMSFQNFANNYKFVKVYPLSLFVVIMVGNLIKNNLLYFIITLVFLTIFQRLEHLDKMVWLKEKTTT